MKIKLTHLIMLGLLLGIVVGTFVNLNADAASIKTYTGIAAFGSIIFLKLIKLIIGPLVLSTLIVGVAGIGDAKTVGRMGVKTIGWFIFASLISLTLGLILVNICVLEISSQAHCPQQLLQVFQLPKGLPFLILLIN